MSILNPKIISIRTKLILIVVTLLVITATGIGIAFYSGATDALLRSEAITLYQGVHNKATELQAQITELSHDVIFLSKTPPTQGIARARANSGFDPFDNSSERLWKQRLAQIFTEFLTSKPDYLQMYYIDAENGGREIVGVIRNDAGVQRISQTNLQRQGDQPFFLSTIKKNPGEFYLSKTEFDKNNGKITASRTPIIRAAIPIFQDKGKLFGIIAIKMRLRFSFTHLKKNQSKYDSKIFVTDEFGQYLAHPDPERISQLGHIENTLFYQDFPELQAIYETGNENDYLGVVKVKDNQDLVIHAQRLYLDPTHKKRFIVFAQATPYATLIKEVNKIRNENVLIVLAIIILGSSFAWFFAVRLTRPLQEITNGIEAFSKGQHNITLPVNRLDEIGRLAKVFQQLTIRLQEKEDALLESEAFKNAVIKTAPEGLITINEKGIIDSFNDTAVKIFKYNPDEIIGQNVKVLMPSPDHENHDQYLEKYLNTGASKIIDIGREVKGRRSDGSVFPLYLGVSEIPVRTGKIRRFTGIVRDLSKSKQSQQDFANQE